MPVVRELINRISFKVNPGDKARAESAFKGIQASGKKALDFALKFGKIAGATFTATATLGLKQFSDIEKDLASVKFFSRTNEEAEKLLETVNKIRGSGLISEKERAQAAAIFAQLTIPLRQIQEVGPILENISIAQPKLDFPQVAEIFAQFVKTGDIESLRQLGAAGKDLVEALRLANIDLEKSAKGQVNRAQLINSELAKQKDRIAELAEQQKGTFTFSVREFSKETSDFATNMGKAMSGPAKDLMKELTALFKELNASDVFWKNVTTVSQNIVDTLKEAIRLAKILTDDEEEEEPSGKVIDPTSLEATVVNIKNIMDKGFIEAFKLESQNREAFRKQEGSDLKSLTGFSGSELIEFGAGQSGTGPVGPGTQQIVISGELKVKGEGVQGMDMKKIGDGVMDNLKEKIKAITAANGGNVSLGL